MKSGFRKMDWERLLTRPRSKMIFKRHVVVTSTLKKGVI